MLTHPERICPHCHYRTRDDLMACSVCGLPQPGKSQVLTLVCIGLLILGGLAVRFFAH